MNVCGIEAGGTKFVLGIRDDQGNILNRQRIDTRDPQSTLDACIDYVTRHRPDALGIASFGPIDLDPHSPTYGFITSTPKAGWAFTPIVSTLAKHFHGPIGFDTDVNAAALAEATWGAGQGCDPLIYLTIGTGIGAGLIVNGKPVHGLLHPEFGHIPLQSLPEDAFKGVCPFHERCLEGLASGPALIARWGQDVSTFEMNHPAWNMESAYLAQACAVLCLTVSPQKIVLGGGVMHQQHLYPMIRQHLRTILNGYLHHPAILNDSDLITSPQLGDDAGLRGAFALADLAYHKP